VDARWDEDPQVTDESILFSHAFTCLLFLTRIQNSNRDFETISAKLYRTAFGLGRDGSGGVHPKIRELGLLDVGLTRVGSKLGQRVWTRVFNVLCTPVS